MKGKSTFGAKLQFKIVRERKMFAVGGGEKAKLKVGDVANILEPFLNLTIGHSCKRQIKKYFKSLQRKNFEWTRPRTDPLN